MQAIVERCGGCGYEIRHFNKSAFPDEYRETIVITECTRCRNLEPLARLKAKFNPTVSSARR